MMNSEARKFSKEELERLLALLNEELEKEGITGEICIVGGAAMVLAFGNRRSTRDIDALLIHPSRIRSAVARIAQEHSLPEDWLNDGAKGFASQLPVESKDVLHFSNLRVITPPADYILAMKCVAARVGLDENDKEDAKFLIRHLGLCNRELVLETVAKYYQAQRIPAKTQYFIEEIWNELFPKSQDRF